MDLNMPTMDGFEATNLIRHHCNNPEKPYIIAVSAANLSEGLVSQCKRSGFNDYFSVPLTSNDIIDRVLPKVFSDHGTVNSPEFPTDKIFSVHEVEEEQEMSSPPRINADKSKSRLEQLKEYKSYRVPKKSSHDLIKW